MAKGSRRRRVVQPRGPQPMYVVAGLPKSIHKEVVDTFQARFPLAIVKGIPSPTRDGALYSAALINTLVRSVGEFAVRRRTRGNAQPTPGSITLLFVPAPDQERLLRRFDFVVMSAPLPTLVVRDEHYQQLRHDREAAVTALVEAVKASSDARANLNHVTRRLGYRSDNEALLLPPRNFMTDDGDLVPTFTDFRQGRRLWTDRLKELGPTALTRDDVPARIQHQQTRRVFVDSRSIGFFIAHPAAYDGAAREVEIDDDVDLLLDTLRSLYRFGGALEPGIHHDAQRSNGSALEGAIFECCEKGRISAKAAYANVYPNDFVRVGDYTAADR